MLENNEPNINENSTKEIYNLLERASTTEELDKIISNLPKTSFVVRIDELREKYELTFSQIQINSGITKSLFYAIVSGTRKSKKNHIIKIGVAMGISLEEMNELLKLAQHKELYAKNKEDAIIIFGLKNKLKIIEIEELLSDYGATLHLLEKE